MAASAVPILSAAAIAAHFHHCSEAPSPDTQFGCLRYKLGARKQPVSRAIEEFERYLNRRYPCRSTARHYVSDLRVFRRLVDKPPRDVSRQDVSRFVEDQLARGLSAATVNRRLACLRCFFEFLAGKADDITWANPVVWRQHRVKEGETLPRDVSEATVEQLFAWISHPRDRLIFSLMCWAGLRVGEVAALRMSDIIPANSGEAGPRLRAYAVRTRRD